MKNLSILTLALCFLVGTSSVLGGDENFNHTSVDMDSGSVGGAVCPADPSSATFLEDVYWCDCVAGNSNSDKCEDVLNKYMYAEYDCWECAQQKDTTLQTAIKYGAGPLASVLNTFIGSYYNYKTNRSWAKAYQNGSSACPQSITDTLPTYLDYLNDRGAAPMLPDQLTALYGECNGQSLGSFAGFGNGYYPYMNGGFSQGFLQGIIGPQSIMGGGGIYGGGGVYGGMGPQPMYPGGGFPGMGGYPGGGYPGGGFPGGVGACVTTPCPFGGNGNIYGGGYGQFGLNGGLNISIGGNSWGGGYAGVSGGLNAYGNANLGAGAYGYGSMNPAYYAGYAGAGMTYPGSYSPQYSGYVDPMAQQVRMQRGMASVGYPQQGGYPPQQGYPQQPYPQQPYPQQPYYPNYGYNQLMGAASVGANGYLNGGFNLGGGFNWNSNGVGNGYSY